MTLHREQTDHHTNVMTFNDALAHRKKNTYRYIFVHLRGSSARLHNLQNHCADSLHGLLVGYKNTMREMFYDAADFRC